MTTEQFTVRPATPAEDPVIATLVVEGFIDKFRPIFGKRMDQSVKIMERWIRLEHASGGVRSLVVEGYDNGEITGSVGVRVDPSEDEAVARGLWRVLQRRLGLLLALRATSLLSYPRYVPLSSEAYVERLVVTPEYRNKGVARSLLHAAEALGRESGKSTTGLHVTANNIPALRLYEAEGYSEVSRQRSMLTGYFLGIKEWLYLQKEL